MKKQIAHLGAAFIYSEKPKELVEWYEKIFGIKFEHTEDYSAWYYSFYYNDIETGRKAYTGWSIVSSKSRPILKEKLFCINYRLYNIEETVTILRDNGIEVKGIDDYPEGKFAWCYDPEGNYIELWEDTALK